MKNKQLVFTLFALIFLPSALSRADAPKPVGHLYAVIFGIVVDESDHVVSIRVVKVTDPSSGSTDAFALKPADSYLAAAESAIRSKGYKAKLKNGRPVEFYTYFFYDPSQPTRVDLEPRSGR